MDPIELNLQTLTILRDYLEQCNTLIKRGDNARINMDHYLKAAELVFKYTSV